ncbi:MAG: GIY-YIG nuclease family protein [Candidatus Babeliales bacterium]|jgi:predicted GIY-YIG superfamily endonuclease
MYYVYLLKSLKNPTKTYIGFTTNLQQRMKQHNSDAPIKTAHTADFRPWKLVTFIGFGDEIKARDFEKYLKVGSGHAFAKRHLW